MASVSVYKECVHAPSIAYRQVNRLLMTAPERLRHDDRSSLGSSMSLRLGKSPFVLIPIKLLA